jgi:hypothetical protein
MQLMNSWRQRATRQPEAAYGGYDQIAAFIFGFAGFNDR